MENNIDVFFGHTENKLDNKYRLIIPTVFRDYMLTRGTLAFAKSSDSRYFKLYTLITLKNEISQKRELLNSCLLANNNEMYNLILDEITQIRQSVLDLADLDIENRVVIPKKVREEYNVDKNLYLLGDGPYIKVFSNKDEYSKYIN